MAAEAGVRYGMHRKSQSWICALAKLYGRSRCCLGRPISMRRLIQQRPGHAFFAVVGETDLQSGRRFPADSVFLPKPGEDVGVPHEPLMIKVRNGSQCLAYPQGEAMAFFDCRPFLRDRKSVV